MKLTAGQQTSAASSSTGAGGRKHKSLAEREADYASARARILGSDYKPGTAGSAGGGDIPVAAAVVNSSGTSREESVKRQPK